MLVLAQLYSRIRTLWKVHTFDYGGAPTPEFLLMRSNALLYEIAALLAMVVN